MLARGKESISPYYIARMLILASKQRDQRTSTNSHFPQAEYALRYLPQGAYCGETLPHVPLVLSLVACNTSGVENTFHITPTVPAAVKLGQRMVSARSWKQLNVWRTQPPFRRSLQVIARFRSSFVCYNFRFCIGLEVRSLRVFTVVFSSASYSHSLLTPFTVVHWSYQTCLFRTIALEIASRFVTVSS